MLEDFLKEIYEKGMTLELLKEASFYSNIRHFFNRRDFWNEASDYLEKVIYDLKETDFKKSVELLESCLKVRDSFNDRHEFASLLDVEVIPKVSDYLLKYNGISVSEGDWTLESSQTGYLTLKDHKGGYVHSPSDPMWESFLYAYSIYDPSVKRYNILGGGLGYLAYQLWRMSDGEADIYVYEIDEQLSIYSDLYGVMSLIDDEKIHYIIGNDTDIIVEKYAEDVPDTKVIRTIYYWDLEKYDGVYANQLKIMLSNEITDKACDAKRMSNFVWNSSIDHMSFSELDKDSLCDEWVVVGAGPSLNDNEDFIKESIGKRTVCIVNTAIKWFYRHGIKPDLVTVCDPSDLLLPHIEGFEEVTEGVPLVADYIANRKFIEHYRGPKYFIYSQGAALTVGVEKVNEDIWSFGGTVTSMALEIAFKAGAKKVHLIGADLSYPGGLTYADSVGHSVRKVTGELKETVVSNDDIEIPSSIIFQEYKFMIERQIAEHANVEVINRSFHGAYLRGTFCGKWWENLPISSDIEDYYVCFENLKKDSLILGWNIKYYIFWQLIENIRLNVDEIDDNTDKLISECYQGIYEAFKSDLNWNLSGEKKRNLDQTYIFVIDYMGDKESVIKNALRYAKNSSKGRQTTLIVNTAERLGGEEISIHDSKCALYDEELTNSDTLKIDNKVYPFFQFPKGMPDVNYYKIFLDSVSKSVPGKLVVTSKYSLLADYCIEIFDIPNIYLDPIASLQ